MISETKKFDNYLKSLKPSLRKFMQKVNKISNVDHYPLKYKNEGLRASKEDEKITPALTAIWCIEGAMGGSCWGGEPKDALIDPEPEPEFEDLDDLLLKIAPNISFLQYKKLCNSVKKEHYRSHEYYGNYSDNMIKYILLEDLYDILKEFDLVS